MEHHEKSRSHSQSYSDVKTLISWSAPGRPFRKRSKEFYITGLMVVLLIDIILFVFSEYLLMFVVLTLYFFSFAITSVAPQNFHYRISTQGIKVEDHFYIWDELYDFYFKKIDGIEILLVRTKAMIPGELKIVLGDIPSDHLRRIIMTYIPYREVIKPTFMEKSSDWLAKNFPLER